MVHVSLLQCYHWLPCLSGLGMGLPKVYEVNDTVVVDFVRRTPLIITVVLVAAENVVMPNVLPIGAEMLETGPKASQFRDQT
jgi:hypothetical protein